MSILCFTITPFFYVDVFASRTPDIFFYTPLTFFSTPLIFFYTPDAFFSTPDTFCYTPGIFFATPNAFFSTPGIFFATPGVGGSVRRGFVGKRRAGVRSPGGGLDMPMIFFFTLDMGAANGSAPRCHGPVAFFKPHTPLSTMISPYYPETNDGRADWWQNIVNIGSGTLAGLGFTVGQTTAINVDALLGVYLYRTLPLTYADFEKRVTGYINTYLSDPDGTTAPVIPSVPTWPPFTGGSTQAGLEARREKWVALAKHAANYDPAVQGAVLRIEQTGTPFDPALYKAEIFGALSPGPAVVSCKFRKARGNVDAMNFKGRSSGSVAWLDLGSFMATPASIHIPLTTPGTPELWQLVGRALVRDAHIGLASDALEVLVRG